MSAIRIIKPAGGWAIAPVVLLLLSLVAPGRVDGATATAQSGYVVPETETWELAAEGSEPYQIFVSRPKGSPPDEGYPVLYVLDGNAYFASFAEARRNEESWRNQPGFNPSIAQSLIVAIGYATDWPFDTRRLYDFTPPNLAQVPPAQARLAKVRAGGQERFLDFLVNRLRPEVARRYSINPHRQALFGHSLGGLFALHVLYTRPNAFHTIIAASPAQGWNNQAILAEERAFAHRLSQAQVADPMSRILILAGEHEELIVRDAEALARRLEPLSAFGLRSRFEELHGETHISVPSRAVTTTLRFAFEWP